METADKTPCSRCGDLYQVTDFYVSGIPFCVECLKRNDRVVREASKTPISTTALLGLVALILGSTVIVVGGILAINFVPQVTQSPTQAKVITIGLALFVFTVLVIAVIRFNDWFKSSWRTFLIAEFGLTHVIQEHSLTVHFATLMSDRSKGSESHTTHIGLLLTNPFGGVFIAGQRHSFGFSPAQLATVNLYPKSTRQLIGLEFTTRADSIYGRRSVILKITSALHPNAGAKKLKKMRDHFQGLIGSSDSDHDSQ